MNCPRAFRLDTCADVQELAQELRKHGYKVETELPLEMADGSGGTRIDMLVESPQGLISALEVKTGDDPFFTQPQLYVYPHLMMGYSVISPNSRIHTLGLPPMTLLPPIPLLLFYSQDANSHQETKWQDPWKLLQEYKRQFGAGGVRKFERELQSKRGASRMTEHEGEDISIIAHNFGGKVLASREVALAMAEMLIRESRGEEYLKTQLPLRAIDRGDRWIVEGSRRGEDYPPDSTGLPEDKFVVKILKRNCQVLSFAGT